MRRFALNAILWSAFLLWSSRQVAAQDDVDVEKLFTISAQCNAVQNIAGGQESSGRSIKEYFKDTSRMLDRARQKYRVLESKKTTRNSLVPLVNAYLLTGIWHYAEDGDRLGQVNPTSSNRLQIAVADTMDLGL